MFMIIFCVKQYRFILLVACCAMKGQQTVGIRLLHKLLQIFNSADTVAYFFNKKFYPTVLLTDKLG